MGIRPVKLPFCLSTILRDDCNIRSAESEVLAAPDYSELLTALGLDRVLGASVRAWVLLVYIVRDLHIRSLRARAQGCQG